MDMELTKLYNRLHKLSPYRQEIKDIEDKICMFKLECDHLGAIVLEEGTSFDGYDRNEYFATIYCSNCGEKFDIYDPNKRSKYKIVDGVTKFNIRK